MGRKPNLEERQARLEKLRQVVTNRSGSLLSTVYTKAWDLYLFQCSNLNHSPFQATYKHVVNQGTWCPTCNREEISRRGQADSNQQMARLQQAVTAKGGTLLTTTYLGSTANYEAKCSDPKHSTFLAQYHKLATQGRWCPECAGRKKKP